MIHSHFCLNISESYPEYTEKWRPKKYRDQKKVGFLNKIKKIVHIMQKRAVFQ